MISFHLQSFPAEIIRFLQARTDNAAHSCPKEAIRICFRSSGSSSSSLLATDGTPRASDRGPNDCRWSGRVVFIKCAAFSSLAVSDFVGLFKYCSQSSIFSRIRSLSVSSPTSKGGMSRSFTQRVRVRGMVTWNLKASTWILKGSFSSA